VPISAFAFDYDGTLADDGKVRAVTLDALLRARASGFTLVMVTGRQLPDLRSIFAHLDLFDAVVAENGALFHLPRLDEERVLAESPPKAFVEALRRRDVRPLAFGRVIVATETGNRTVVSEAIAESGAPWRMIFNKESLMCLPTGVDKASGLEAALAALGLPAERALGVGDAENDMPLLAACGVGAAVANALPMLKAAASIVAEGDAGAGVAWLIDRVLDDPALGWLSGTGAAQRTAGA
jgi:HAD superfamily hydrolase (TIGR01484 family)